MTDKTTSQMFNKVNAAEKRVIFRSLPQRRTKIMIKYEEQVAQVFALTTSTEKVLACELIPVKADEEPSDVVVKFEKQEAVQVVIDFKFNEDRYFMQTTANMENDKVQINLDPDLFVLQRRRSARVDIPFSYPHQVRVIEHHGKVVFIEGRIVDFGAGGCRVEVLQMDPLFSVSDQVVLVIRLSHRNPLTLKAQVRHTVGTSSAGNQIFGVQFQGLGPIMENKMMSLLMEVQKELFTKFNA